ncbi:helix-turn-helix domain-containing protein [Streptosporangium sp. NBC_01755]|uniref:helix-turn-helix domain-containing protein n=1 Tax=Streptosporangium sp. NBC_01755 TaxID=2975949 RepID=UPI002DD9CF19|nr:helix-turn-helix domain-containing protein [Streptosporangium sp. NBC_01755]WSD01532.1 helix-turn-helix domain-containing protein [Streptosporangium sp. NBC_01755]
MHEAPHNSETSTESPPKELLYTPKEAAELVLFSHFWLLDKARKREIDHHKIGRRYFFSRANLDAINASTVQRVRKSA